MGIIFLVAIYQIARLFYILLVKPLFGIKGNRLGGWEHLMRTFSLYCLVPVCIYWTFVLMHYHIIDEKYNTAAWLWMAIILFGMIFMWIPTGSKWQVEGIVRAGPKGAENLRDLTKSINMTTQSARVSIRPPDPSQSGPPKIK